MFDWKKQCPAAEQPFELRLFCVVHTKLMLAELSRDKVELWSEDFIVRVIEVIGGS